MTRPDTREDILTLAASRYLGAVAALGQQCGYNGQTYFEVPIFSMPDAGVKEETMARWLELNEAGKALQAALGASRTAPRSISEDEIADTIQDSLDMDWTPRDGARAVMKLLASPAPKGEGQ